VPKVPKVPRVPEVLVPNVLAVRWCALTAPAAL
jgi:hypothetical protein